MIKIGNRINDLEQLLNKSYNAETYLKTIVDYYNIEIKGLGVGLYRSRYDIVFI